MTNPGRTHTELPVVLAVLLGCSSASSPGASPADGGDVLTDGATADVHDTGSSGDAADGGCPLAANTSPTGTVTNGCALLARDTSACQAARTAQGLSGFWLKMSCRVTLTVTHPSTGAAVQLTSDGQPDYPSNYFVSASPCHSTYSTMFPDPNTIIPTTLTVTVPMTPSGAGQAMGLGPVGMAVNGVAVFDNQAAPGDDIFQESGSFDRCQGHPQQQGMYHYHSEPYAISYDDDRFIGVMKDGNPIYGRRDPDGSTPSNLDTSGGHTGVTVDSPSKAVYHYHLNLQVSTNAQTSGEKVWFLTTGTYANTPGS